MATCTWTVWNTDRTNSTTSFSDCTWTIWNEGSCSSTTTNYTTAVWGAWTATSGSVTITLNSRVTPPPETEEQKAARLARAAEHQRQHEEREKARLAAVEKAKRLLQENLNDEQRKEFAESGHFHVITASGDRYRVRTGRHGNVDKIAADGKRVESLCIHATTECPDYDNMLAQKLMLETDEKAFRKIANITRHAA